MFMSPMPMPTPEPPSLPNWVKDLPNNNNVDNLSLPTKKGSASTSLQEQKQPVVTDEVTAPFQSQIAPTEMRQLALVAHNHMKPAMKQFIETYSEILKKFRITGTQTTMKMCKSLWGENDPSIHYGLTCTSGPLGGDAQIAALMCCEDLGGLIFFVDPLSAHPHQADIDSLIRLANCGNIFVCCNPTSASSMMHILRRALLEGGSAARETIPSFFETLESPAVEEYKHQQAAALADVIKGKKGQDKESASASALEDANASIATLREEVLSSTAKMDDLAKTINDLNRGKDILAYASAAAAALAAAAAALSLLSPVSNEIAIFPLASSLIALLTVIWRGRIESGTGTSASAPAALAPKEEKMVASSSSAVAAGKNTVGRRVTFDCKGEELNLNDNKEEEYSSNNVAVAEPNLSKKVLNLNRRAISRMDSIVISDAHLQAAVVAAVESDDEDDSEEKDEDEEYSSNVTLSDLPQSVVDIALSGHSLDVSNHHIAQALSLLPVAVDSGDDDEEEDEDEATPVTMDLDSDDDLDLDEGDEDEGGKEEPVAYPKAKWGKLPIMLGKMSVRKRTRK